MSASLPISFPPKAVEDAKATTAGELLFDRITYTGVGFILNEALSIALTDMVLHGHGKPYTDKAGTWLAESLPNLFKDKVVNGAIQSTATQNATSKIMFAALTTPGTVLMVPIKWMEDHEKTLVKSLNHLVDKLTSKHLTPEEQAVRDNIVDERIATQPSQTWGSLIGGRVIGLGWAMGLGHALGPHRIDGIQDFSENLLMKPAKPGVNPDWRRRYSRLAGIETVTCSTTAVVMESSSKFMAWLGGRHKKHETFQARVVSELESQTPSVAP